MSVIDLFWAARYPPIDHIYLSFKGKTVLVTGASSGLGLHAAIKYAAQGASTLILGVRTVEKGVQAKAAIVEATGCSPNIIVILALNLDSLASVYDFAARLDAIVPELHIIQLAGGADSYKYEPSQNGLEMALQCNVLSPTLIALLLLPKLHATAAALPAGSEDYCYISFVNSTAHLEVEAGDIPEAQSLLQLIHNPDEFEPTVNYYLVKLVGWFAMRGVAKLCDGLGDCRGTRIIVNASCPGLCKTNMMRHAPLTQRIIMGIAYFIMGRTAEQGSRTLVSATALGPESHGRFWTDDNYPARSELLASNRGFRLFRKTWSEISAILCRYVIPQDQSDEDIK
ncbi:hypothetical protein F5Y13DRAFT_204233 [Hypoxylon sp. FL1857]|nr:hypothetical protein F5Y13DRAFT_204233 [Hypoxylon sp. FL1857]